MDCPGLPQGFTPLFDINGCHGKSYNVMGVCVDHLQPVKSRGTDYTATIQLRDFSWHYDKGLRLRFFSPNSENFPRIADNGDVVILRNLMSKDFQGQTIVYLNHTTKWIVIPKASLLQSTSPEGADLNFSTSGRPGNPDARPSPEERQYAKNLFASEDPSNFATSVELPEPDAGVVAQNAEGKQPTPQLKWRLIQDLEDPTKAKKNIFADLFGEVRKVWRNDRGSIELSLTDYTSNKLLFNYTTNSQSREGDEYGYSSTSNERWPGPWGKMTIQVVLFDAHAEYAREWVSAGKFVVIRNCHIKLDSQGSRLEAACRGDRNDSSRVNVRILDSRSKIRDPRFDELFQRRNEYQELAKSKGLRFSLEDLSRKGSANRSADADGIDANNGGLKKSKMSKNAKKRKKQKRKLAEANGDNQAKTSLGTAKTNSNVRCKNIEVPVKSIEDVLDPEILKRETALGHEFQLPFQNCSYKAKVRVVDYFPENIADFAVSRRKDENETLSEDEDMDASDRESLADGEDVRATRWEWRFFLVVEDASVPRSITSGPQKQMALLVADTEGDYLLNALATNLRENPQELEKLKEKLFHLWGDLQERKDEEEEARSSENPADIKPKSRPFECFIKEYGVPLGREAENDSAVEYQRMFRMCGTCISS